MRNLILLFIRNGGLLLFLLLEGLCMFLVVQFNKKQNDIYFRTTAAFTGAVYNQVDEITKYWNLSSVADNIARENAQLLRQLEELKPPFYQTPDTTSRDSSLALYEFIPAKVISNSIGKHNNHLILNVGSTDSIAAGMGVIGGGGLVGVVRSVTADYAIVMSLLHKESRISAAIERTGHFGVLVWQANDPMRARLINIPKHASPSKQDTIVTSGYSTIFPEGLMVGTIEGIDMEGGSNTHIIDVALSNDLSRIKYVYVIKHLKAEQLSALKEEVENE